MTLRRKLFLTLIVPYRAHTYLWLSLVLPSFLTLGKIHFVFPVIFVWALLSPYHLPWISLLLGGLIQDILLEYPLGCHSLMYSVFLCLVLSQKQSIHKRSFTLRWTVLGIFILVCEGGKLLFLSKQLHMPDIIEALFYSFLIPWFSFPLFIEKIQGALLGFIKRHG